MCGRYALGIRASFVRYQLQQQGMQVDNAPDDDAARETYNFPPGSYGLVYRAEVPDSGVRSNDNEQAEAGDESTQARGNEPSTEGRQDDNSSTQKSTDGKSFNYELKVMKWGLIPFWTKRSPDYGSMMRTINCRDDSLLENRGMWTTMKQRKRCIVVAQGFYEWLKKGPGGKEKIPHFVKRKDGQLMCFAGLWDCVKYEDAEDKLYTYSIITTDSNKQLTFLHDRMPVILDPNTAAMNLWLDPTQTKWTNDLQSILKPFEGELECYPVNKDVGKVGNNSPDFIVPIDSKENKKNIANFFDNAKAKQQKSNSPKKSAITTTPTKTTTKPENEPKDEQNATNDDNEYNDIDPRETKTTDSNSETHAPLPIPPSSQGGLKRKVSITDESQSQPQSQPTTKQPKLGEFSPSQKPTSSSQSPTKNTTTTPSKKPSNTSTTKKTRSATSNEGLSKKPSPVKNDGTQRITSFFGRG